MLGTREIIRRRQVNARSHFTWDGGQPEDIGDTVRFIQAIDNPEARSSYTRRIMSMLHRAGLLASGYKRFSPGLPIPFNSGTVAFSG
jgi:hypothetical protein